MWEFVITWTIVAAAAAAGLQQHAANSAASDRYPGIPDLATDGGGGEVRDRKLLSRRRDLSGDARTQDAVHVKAVDEGFKWRPRLIVQEQLAPAPVPGNKATRNHSLKDRHRPVTNSGGVANPLDGIAAPAEGRPGKIVLLSPGQLFNDSGQYRVFGTDRVRKTPGFEIAYDYYFKAEEPIQRTKLKSVATKSVPLILASSFLVILVICVAVCIAAICWKKTHRTVTRTSVSSATTTTAGTMTCVSQRNAAGDSITVTQTEEKYVV